MEKKVLTRAPMFGKSLPLNNDTSSNNEEVCVTKKMGSYLGHMNRGHRMMQKCKAR
jgi:hypothetical protein